MVRSLLVFQEDQFIDQFFIVDRLADETFQKRFFLQLIHISTDFWHVNIKNICINLHYQFPSGYISAP